MNQPSVMQRAILELTQQMIALTGRPGATSFLRVDLSNPIPAGAGQKSQAAPLIFEQPGVVVGMYGQELTATAAKYGKTELRLQMGTKDLASYGQGGGGAYLPFLALFPPGQPVTALMRPVDPSVPWVFTFQNQDAAAECSPIVVLSFIGDADLDRMARR